MVFLEKWPFVDHLAPTKRCDFQHHFLTCGKMHQVVWNALVDYGCLEWQHMLKDLQKPQMLPTRMFLTKLIRFGVLTNLLSLLVS